MNAQLNRRLHGLLAQVLPADTDLRLAIKQDLVEQYTNGRTNHSSHMTDYEARQLADHLQAEKDRKTKPMRAKIVHLLCLMEYTTDEGDPDYDRINAFVKNIGSRNPKKKNLYWLTIKETLSVLNQVEAIYKKQLSQ